MAGQLMPIMGRVDTDHILVPTLPPVSDGKVWVGSLLVSVRSLHSMAGAAAPPPPPTPPPPHPTPTPRCAAGAGHHPCAEVR